MKNERDQHHISSHTSAAVFSRRGLGSVKSPGSVKSRSIQRTFLPNTDDPLPSPRTTRVQRCHGLVQRCHALVIVGAVGGSGRDVGQDRTRSIHLRRSGSKQSERDLVCLLHPFKPKRTPQAPTQPLPRKS